MRFAIKMMIIDTYILAFYPTAHVDCILHL